MFFSSGMFYDSRHVRTRTFEDDYTAVALLWNANAPGWGGATIIFFHLEVKVKA